MKDYFKIMSGCVFAVLVFAAIGFALRPVDKMVDRAVQVNSHQYIEGMEQRARVLEANIAEVDALLLMNPENKEALLAQKRALSAQLKATIK